VKRFERARANHYEAAQALQAFRDGRGDDADDVGALLLADGLHALRLVREFLTKRK
jgi:hypothetical protein